MLAANQGAVGGGEVMLLLMAMAARASGLDVSVVATGPPWELAEAAEDAGFRTVRMAARDRREYMVKLRRWAHGSRALLWCNGLVPALATAGRPERVVHLHQAPALTQRAAAAIACRGARRVVVPSAFMATCVPGATVLSNWTSDVVLDRPRKPDRGQVVGFLGRMSQDKGLDVLIDAVSRLHRRGNGGPSLLIVGDYRFVPPRQQQLIETNLRSVTYPLTSLPWLERERFFEAVDLAVFPSRWDEPFGLVAAESMAARVPFIISDAGALSEVAGPDHPWTAPTGDAIALSGLIEQALRGDNGSVVADARARWQAKYSPQAGQARYARVLFDLGMAVDGPR